jgi:ribosome maturation factor RimP
MVKTIEEKIKELVEEKLAEPGFESYFLIEIKIKGSKLEVFVDADTAINFDICKKISRHIESWLDESGALGEQYVLDVSSAGVGRPLVNYRQYIKNKGRDLEVTTLEGTTLTGVLLEADESLIQLKIERKEKIGKKTVLQEVNESIPYENIKKAIVKIRF